MSRSERFSTINFAQAMRPHSMVSSGEKFGRFIKKHLPEDREFDSVPLSPNEPQEEEMALTCMSIHSTYHQGIFRRNRSEILEKALYVKLWSDDKQEQFASTYDYLAKKISFADKAHRPLLLKNPANTTRIDFLRKIYPEARFIHIVRKPSDVIRSFRSTLEWMFQHYSLHGSCHLPDLDVTIAEYTRIMRSHLEQREGLGEQCYCEVHYESLRDEPMKTVRSINESLGLKFGQPEFERIQTYLESVADYQPTQRDSDPEWESKIANEVAFAYQQWGYE